MHKLVVLYPAPDDPNHFREHYEHVHVPLAKGVPGIRSMQYAFDVATDGDGAQSDLSFFCVFEAVWDDEKALIDAMTSPEGQAVIADVANYATGGYIRMHYQVEP